MGKGNEDSWKTVGVVFILILLLPLIELFKEIKEEMQGEWAKSDVGEPLHELTEQARRSANWCRILYRDVRGGL